MRPEDLIKQDSYLKLLLSNFDFDFKNLDLLFNEVTSVYKQLNENNSFICRDAYIYSIMIYLQGNYPCYFQLDYILNLFEKALYERV